MWKEKIRYGWKIALEAENHLICSFAKLVSDKGVINWLTFLFDVEVTSSNLQDTHICSELKIDMNMNEEISNLALKTITPPHLSL